MAWTSAGAIALAAGTLLACTPASEDPCGPGAYTDDVDGQCYCEPGFHGDPDLECVAHDDLCAEAQTRLGHLVCEHVVEDEAQWNQLSLGGGPASSGVRRLGKFMVPAVPTARLPTVFSDANRYRLHYCLMSAGFEPLFPGLTTADHAQLILTRASREFFAGATYEFEDERPLRYGFSVEAAARPEEVFTVDEIYAIHRQLADRFEPGDLAFVPRGTLQEEAAAKWVDPPFAVATTGDASVTYETYTPGIAYGRVRLAAGAEPASFSWQDIAVFDEVPLAHEGVLAAAITGQRQDLLSHLNVLSGQRGTPNVFVDDAIALFTPFEGELVRLEADAGSYTLVLADQAEAEAWWQAHRPSAPVENPAEFEHATLDSFAAIPTATAEQRASARSRFGAKTVGLATLSPLIDARYQTPGFGVPFRYYDEFMTTNTWDVDLGAGPTATSYADTIAAWLADPAFRSDPLVRQAKLGALREEMGARGVVSAELVALLRDRIVEEFGSDSVMVRVRSSSNAEDTPTFNGAGLYDSVSACAADSFTPGPVSLCDADKDPRTLEAALAQVWASLWNYGAFEERDYYQIDHALVAMGATISLRYEDEQANGVAFTGNPRDAKSDAYLVNAQLGELDVVSPTPGVTAELSYLTIEGGVVAEINRAVASSLVPAGQPVVSDAHLSELGGLMAELATTYPVDYVVADAEPLLDLEFKINDAGDLVIKQIRTFVPTTYSSDPTCRD